MEIANDDKKIEWLRRRKRTTFVFYMQNFLLGVEYSLTFTYLYLYLKDVLHTEKVILFYSAISTVFLLTMVVASLVCGRIFDKLRNLRQMFIICNSMIFLGNLLYCIPLSPWLLFFGRLFAGIGGSSRSIMSGEIVRCYIGQDVLKELLRLGMTFGIGFIAGPGMNFFFLGADFNFLGIHITYINGAVLVLVFAALFQLGASVFFVSDLSKEYDPKGEAEKEDAVDGSSKTDDATVATDEDEAEKQPLLQSGNILYQQRESNPNMWVFFKSLAKHKQIALIFMFSGFYFFSDCLYDIWQPMAFVQFIGWENLQINLVNFGYGICSIIFFTALTLVSPSQMGVLYLVKCTMLENMILMSIFLVWKFYNGSFVLNVTTSVFYCILFAMTILMEEVFLINALAQLVSTEKQSFAEGVRLACSRTGALASLLISPVLFDYLEYVCPVFITIMIVFLVLLHLNQSWYINPKVIVF